MVSDREREYARAYYERVTVPKRRARGVRPLAPFAHGSKFGVDWHRRRGEPPCQACRKAWNEYARDWKKRKRTNP